MATTTPAWMIRAAEVWLLAAAVAAATSPADSTAGPSGNDNTGINGAEFSNNFISDLSPLLALFGERFAQQFMSFSTSWIDSLLFAVAPLGIITAIVSAVRVGGPSWLRTLVGRARETRAAAEVELMSSTSHEVCEIWNGDAIVRVMGTPEIVELLYFENLPIGWNSKEQQAGQSTMPDNDPQPNNGITGEQGNITGTEECEIFTLEEAIFRKLVIKVNRTYFHNFLPWPFKQNPDQDKNSVHESSSTQPPPGDEPSDIERGPSGASTTNPDSNGGKLLDAYEMSTPDTLFNNYKAPNISLNLSVSRNTRELYIAAIFGILVQITVLVVAGLVSYHPGLKLTKGGTSVQEYAYPLTSGGTLLLVLGMFICASVVEQSTTEKTFKKADGIKKAKLYILWLQRGQLIGDQTFESYAMVAEEPAEEIWTSSRQRSREELPVSPFTSASATLGTVISISGFVLQFLGLRGSHWVVSLAQLAATMLMTAVRALIRRGMSKQPSTVRLAKDFELEWLASAMSKDRNNFGNNYSSLRDEKRKDHHWTTQKWAKTPQLNRCMQKFLKKFKTDDRKDPKVYLSPTLRVLTGGKSINSDNAVLHDARPVLPDARSFIHIRQRLGLLTQWSNPASDAAVSVADSMELVLNTLLPSNAEPFKWGISVSVDGNPQRVVMTVKRDAGIFRVGLAEIEALLSLWLQHAHLREQRDKEKEIMRKQEDRKSKSEESKSTRYSNRLKRENFKQNLWILGKDNHLLQQDLSWWLPKIDDTRVLCIGKGTEMDCYATDSKPKESHHRIDYHRIIGFGGAEGAMPGRECFAVDFECPAVSFDEQDGGTPDQSKPRYTDDSDTENGHFLAVMSNTQRELLFAQHIFAAFMSAVATEIPRIGGFTEASHSMTNLPTAWEHYQLKNEQVSFRNQ
ncbi:hypothetical protein BZA77DRAFT_65879 [Pyronema omphalodes]|nr:hypothetical protein BZA77DRAFT_65879 [Pyronema omphalodes]